MSHILWQKVSHYRNTHTVFAKSAVFQPEFQGVTPR